MFFPVKYDDHKKEFIAFAIADNCVIYEMKRFHKNNTTNLFEWIDQFCNQSFQTDCIAFLENDFYESDMQFLLSKDILTRCNIILIDRRKFAEFTFFFTGLNRYPISNPANEQDAALMAVAIKFYHHHFLYLWEPEHYLPF